MHRTLPTFVLSAIVICGVMSSAEETFGQSQPVNVSVFSDVPIPEQVLALAEQSASQIFSSAGVAVVWINCVHGPSATPDQGCIRTYGLRDLVLRITSHISSATSDAAFGVAWLDADGSGRYADVFWTRAQELRTNSNADLGRILGSVMAHEIGHLLLGANSHSTSGLMQPRWSGGALHRIVMGTLLFSPAQGAQMQAHLSSARVAIVTARNGQRGIEP
jgi:hypothetical protein